MNKVTLVRHRVIDGNDLGVSVVFCLYYILTCVVK